MLEKNAKQGVLTFGIDPEEFTKETFSDSCQNVLSHIKKKGPRIKNLENLQEVTEQLRKLESKLDDSSSNTTMKYSDDNPEVQWYTEIMRDSDNYPADPSSPKPDAKVIYSKIQILRQEIKEISNSYNHANPFEKPTLTRILQTKRKGLKELLSELSDIWFDSSEIYATQNVERTTF